MKQPLSATAPQNVAAAFACLFRERDVSSSKAPCPTRYLFLFRAPARHLRSQDLICLATSSKSADVDREEALKPFKRESSSQRPGRCSRATTATFLRCFFFFFLLFVVSPEQRLSLSDASPHHQAAANESAQPPTRSVTPLRPTSFHQHNIFPLTAH